MVVGLVTLADSSFFEDHVIRKSQRDAGAVTVLSKQHHFVCTVLIAVLPRVVAARDGLRRPVVGRVGQLALEVTKPRESLFLISDLVGHHAMLQARRVTLWQPCVVALSVLYSDSQRRESCWSPSVSPDVVLTEPNLDVRVTLRSAS